MKSKAIPTGTRVTFNDQVAVAFVGQPGTITGHREDVNNGTLNVVTLDNPNAGREFSSGYGTIKTLAVKHTAIDF